MKKRLLSVALALCMMLTLVPTTALAAETENDPTKSIADSSLYFGESDGATQYSTDNTNWITYTGSFTITGSSVNDTTVTNTVIVQSGIHNIILSDCAIGAATDTYTEANNAVSGALSPFDIQGGRVNLTLIGSNKLYSANPYYAGLHVAPGASLFVTAESTGALDARSRKHSTLWGSGAGIGGNHQGTSGTITIQGGEISAYSYHGAGIGGGNNSSSALGNITVTGGTVFAQADSNGIGRGNATASNVLVVVTGGSVNALKGSTPSIGGTLQNGSGAAVELYTLTLSGVTSPTAVTALTLPEGYSYGITSMKTDATGKLYLYMPTGKTGAVSVTTGAKTYYGSIAGNEATLLSPTIGMLSIPGHFTAGSSLTLSDLNTNYTPAVTTVSNMTVTAQGWQYLVDSGDWTTWSVGELPLDTTSTYKLRYYMTCTGVGGSTTITSNEVTLNVVGNTTALALAASPASQQTVGSSVTLTATLTGYFTGPGVNGQAITFKNGGTDLGTANLNASGVAVFTWMPDSTGSASLTAEYAATAYNTAAASSTVNYTVIIDSDITAVAAAKTAAQNASYGDRTQTAATDEDAIKAALKNTAETAVNNSDITVIINKVSYTPPIAGTSANPSGTNGSYTFSVAVSKGSQSDTTVQKTIVITSTPYTGVTDAQAVTAAKTALVDGTVNVAFGADQTAKTAAVQAYVNGLLTGEAAGVTATVPYNSGTGKYDVALSKGSVNDSKSLSMNVNVAPDPDIAIVAAAKTAAQGAGYANMTQAAAPNESAIKAALKSTAETAVSNNSITVTINKVGYTAPIAGTSANPGGTNGSYTFTVTVSKGTPSETTAQKTITITATAYTDSIGSGSGGGGGTTPTGAPVIVDGKTQNIGTEKKSGDATTVTVDQSKLSAKIGGAASGSSVVVPVSGNGSATASLVVKNIEDMADRGMTLTVQTGSVAYNLNASAIDTAALAAAFPGADTSKVPFNVTIKNGSATVEGETLVLPPVEFTVTATYNGKTVSVDTFSAYIDRVIEVTAEQAAKITTAVVANADGSTRHVPTNVIEKDDKYYAVINSRTNSAYALIQNEVTFADAKGKWYEAAVNEMGSRKIINGVSEGLFAGARNVTRAEFTVILVRALGLPADGTSTFSDVPTTAWYSGAVGKAVQYGLVKGKRDNCFDPKANITRQEAMAILQRAAALTEFTGASGDLDGFADANSVGSWAQDAAKWSVGSGLIQGAHGKLNPTADITRAESAAIILRLLQKAGLVDVRSKT